MGIALLFGQAYAADKFAYVDLSKIFAEYNKTKDYDKVLEGKKAFMKQREISRLMKSNNCRRK